MTTSTYDWMGNQLPLDDPDQGRSAHACSGNDNLTLSGTSRASGARGGNR